MLWDNPWQKRLDKFAVLAPLPLPGGGMLVAQARF
jgi:hypothetical protein